MKKILLILLMALLVLPSASYGNFSPYTQGYIEGYLLDVVGESTLHIEAYNGDRYFFPIARNASFAIDTIPVGLKEFLPGMEVYAKLDRGRGVIYMEGYSTSSLGYITPGSKVRTGTVSNIDRNQLWVKLPTGEEVLYFTSPATLATKKGVRVNLSTLYQGDRIKMFFDEANTNIISRLQIEGESIVIKDLYKGRLHAPNRFDNILTLEDVQVFRNGDWEKLSQSKNIRFSDNHPIYIGGHKIARNSLRHYQGSTVYMAVKDFFGYEQVEKMVLKSQHETTYSDKIRAINWYTEAFELANNRNFGFHDGTIIIKNGRLVDKYAINSKADIFVVGDGRGDSRLADVVYIYNVDINNSNIGHYQLYAGRMNTIVENKLWLKDFFLLTNNDWESFSGEKELFYDNDTYIFDLESRRQLTVKEFFSGSYAVDENSQHVRDNNLRDWHCYAYTDGDRIVSIKVMKNMDSLLRQRVTNGIVQQIENDELVGWALTLMNANDWSAAKSQWMPKNTAIRVTLDKTLLIKGEEPIHPEDIKPGDRVYLVRDDFHGKVLLIK